MIVFPFAMWLLETWKLHGAHNVFLLPSAPLENLQLQHTWIQVRLRARFQTWPLRKALHAWMKVELISGGFFFQHRAAEVKLIPSHEKDSWTQKFLSRQHLHLFSFLSSLPFPVIPHFCPCPLLSSEHLLLPASLWVRNRIQRLTRTWDHQIHSDWSTWPNPRKTQLPWSILF